MHYRLSRHVILCLTPTLFHRCWICPL